MVEHVVADGDDVLVDGGWMELVGAGHRVEDSLECVGGGERRVEAQGVEDWPFRMVKVDNRVVCNCRCQLRQ